MTSKKAGGTPHKYDFTKARRAKDVPHLQALTRAKTRITIMLDDDVIEHFRQRAGAEGRGYQTAINEALRIAMHYVRNKITTAASP